ncbi:unnamed protein product [Candida verbasci]|uniref:Cystathionine gamma-synthase n=1 Tax=Candida verbasci TaxID=1227364 RepID=A0A9W4XC00_9ASCO|nr:unnamed protein product [Candida verbasci]
MTQFSTKSIHSGDHLRKTTDIAPPIHVSTTYSYDSNPANLIPGELTNPDTFVYSRENHPNAAAIEAIVEDITGYPAIVYNSGLSAFNAVMMHVNPKTIAIGQAYHGCIGIVEMWQRNFGLRKIDIESDDQSDLLHLETPVNPYGLYFDISKYAEKAHSKGALLSIDSTFAPPPLIDPFKFGADIVIHSATKFFGGHSDLLAGLVLVKSHDIKNKFLKDRLVLGTNIGNLESALLVRSLRTLELRVKRQSKTAEFIVKFLNENKHKIKDLEKIYHGSLQNDDYISEQMNGHTPVFSIELVSEEKAKEFPSKLKYFYHATSLGGVESLIEWRAMSDPHISKKLLRISIGLEDPRDLLQDLLNGLVDNQELTDKVRSLNIDY